MTASIVFMGENIFQFPRQFNHQGPYIWIVKLQVEFNFSGYQGATAKNN
jgi:hypothetical protein